MSANSLADSNPPSPSNALPLARLRMPLANSDARSRRPRCATDAIHVAGRLRRMGGPLRPCPPPAGPPTKGMGRTSRLGPIQKIWRQPTLAEARQPLPSAMRRLTAEFGMGSGRTTASWPPKNCQGTTAGCGFSENYTQAHSGKQFARFEIADSLKWEKAIKPHDRLVSVRSTRCRACTPDLSTRWSTGGL